MTVRENKLVICKQVDETNIRAFMWT